jgi:hypothetical protein
MRAIASLGCEGAMRAITSSMLPHAFPQRGLTLTYFAATAGGIAKLRQLRREDTASDLNSG